MAYSARLCNPTPWQVDLNWDRGIIIVVPPFGSAELSMQQMDDFRPGKPGSAEVKQVLDYHGVFLMDTDRTYDQQALEALRRAYKAKKDQFDGAFQRLQDRRAQAGVAPNPDALEETLRQMGYAELRNKVNSLKEGIVKFEAVVKETGDVNLRPQLDPARTVFVTNPPREFPSVAAMEFFLEKNPEIKAKHESAKGRAKPRGLSAMSDSQKFIRETDDRTDTMTVSEAVEATEIE